VLVLGVVKLLLASKEMLNTFSVVVFLDIDVVVVFAEFRKTLDPMSNSFTHFSK